MVDFNVPDETAGVYAVFYEIKRPNGKISTAIEFEVSQTEDVLKKARQVVQEDVSEAYNVSDTTKINLENIEYLRPISS